MQIPPSVLKGEPSYQDSRSLDVGSWVYLQGEAYSSTDNIAGGWIKLAIPNSPTLWHRFGDRFLLRLSEGGDAKISLPADAAVGPIEEKKGTWSELEKDPLSAPLRDRGPGPHLSVTRQSAILSTGERVVVFGKVLAASQNGEPALVEAVAVFWGEEAKKLLDKWRSQYKGNAKEKKAPPSRSLLRVVFLLGLLAALVFAAVRVATQPLSLLVFMAYSMLVLLVWFVFRDKETIPSFYYYNPERGHKYSIERYPALNGISMVFLLLGGLACFSGLPALSVIATIFEPLGEWSRKDKEGATAIFLIFSSAVALLLFSLTLLSMAGFLDGRKLTKVLLDAPRNPEDGSWGSFLGKIRDLTPVEFDGTRAALYLQTARLTERLGGKTRTTTEANTQKTRDTFFLDTERGSLEIDPMHLLWATTHKQTYSQQLANGKTRSGELELLPDGAAALVVGRCRDGKMSASGPEALWIFCAGDDPAAKLAAFIQRYRRSFLIFFGMFVLYVSLGSLLLRWFVSLP